MPHVVTSDNPALDRASASAWCAASQYDHGTLSADHSLVLVERPELFGPKTQYDPRFRLGDADQALKFVQARWSSDSRLTYGGEGLAGVQKASFGPLHHPDKLGGWTLGRFSQGPRLIFCGANPGCCLVETLVDSTPRGGSSSSDAFAAVSQRMVRDGELEEDEEDDDSHLGWNLQIPNPGLEPPDPMYESDEESAPF